MSELSSEYPIGAAAVLRRLQEQKPEYWEALKSLSKNDVAFLTGTYDHVQTILGHLGIPVSSSVDKSTKVLFVNCGSNVDVNSGVVEKVKNGMHLVSSDWALSAVEKAFPKMVRKLPKQSGDEVISVEANLGSVWDGVVTPGANPQWWLESSSYVFEILDEEKVKIEAASHELLQKYDSPYVAVSFKWGEGSVFHVTSHFYCKKTRSEVAKHKTGAVDFLREGMKLSEEGIEALLKSHPKISKMNFGTMQTVATSTELIAQLAARAKLMPA